MRRQKEEAALAERALARRVLREVVRVEGSAANDESRMGWRIATPDVGLDG